MEESKSLASFQIAGLLIQNSFRFLISALKSYYKRRQLKYYALWRHKTLYTTKATQAKIKNSMILLQTQVSKFQKLLQSRVKSSIHNTLLRIISTSKYIELEKKLQKDEERAKNSNQQELQTLTKDLKNMQDHQEELEKTLKKLKNREDNYKSQIAELSGKKNELAKSKKRNIREKEEEILERIEELKEENSDIREKIALIENNVSSFISEMGGLLEYSEEAEKTADKRRASVKKGKVAKKPRGPLFTLDIGKN